MLLGNGAYNWLVLSDDSRGRRRVNVCVRDDLADNSRCLLDDASGRHDDWRDDRRDGRLGASLLFLGRVFRGLRGLAGRRQLAAPVAPGHPHDLKRVLVYGVFLEREVVDGERAVCLVYCKQTDPE